MCRFSHTLRLTVFSAQINHTWEQFEIDTPQTPHHRHRTSTPYHPPTPPPLHTHTKNTQTTNLKPPPPTHPPTPQPLSHPHAPTHPHLHTDQPAALHQPATWQTSSVPVTNGCPVLSILVTTSLCQDCAICAPAASLRGGSRFHGATWTTRRHKRSAIYHESSSTRPKEERKCGACACVVVLRVVLWCVLYVLSCEF